jgi:hypothetical protein
MRRFSKTPVVVAATLVSATALASDTLAAEPLRLSAAQMDAVTAGVLPFQASSAAAVAVGAEGTLALTGTTAITSVKNDMNASASGDGSAIAASDMLAATEGTGIAHVEGDHAYVGVIADTSGVAVGEDALSASGFKTSATKTGAVYKASGTAYTYVDGEIVYAEATVIPYGDGALVLKNTGASTQSTTEPGLVAVSGSIMIVDAPGLRGRGVPGKR